MAYNQSIFEQISGTLGSEYAQTVGMLARDKDKRSKKERNKKILASILFSGLNEGAKQFKLNIEDKIKNLSEQSVWDTNYTKELWQQATQIKAIDADYRKAPDSYFYKMAVDSMVNTPMGQEIAAVGGVNNLSSTAKKAYMDFIKQRETEYINNHQIRMENPTADISTFKEFSEADRNMLATQTNNLKNDPANRSLLFAALRKLGVGKDNEIEFTAEVQANLKEQQKRWEAAEAYIAPLDVTKFIDYDVKNKEAIFTVGSNLDLKNSDPEKTRLLKELADEDNTIWGNISFTDEYGMYDINNLPLNKLKGSGTNRYGGKPFTVKSLNNMELYNRVGSDEKGDLRFEKSTPIRGAVPYLINDMYALERNIHAMQTAEVRSGTRETVDSLENRYAMALQQLVNNGHIRIDRDWRNNYIYIPANSGMEPIDLPNSETPEGNGTPVDTLTTIHEQTELANAQDFEEVYSKHLEDRTDAANRSGDIEELEFLESIKGVESKASEEARLMFMINPPKELAGITLTFPKKDNTKQKVVIGSPNEDYDYYYNLFKNNADTSYGPSEAIENLLNSRNSKGSEDSPPFFDLTLEKKERKDVEQELSVVKEKLRINQLKNSDRLTFKEIIELNKKKKELENILNIK